MIRTWAVRAVAILTTLATARVMWIAIAYFDAGRVARHRLEAAWFVLVLVGLVWIALSSASSDSRVPPDRHDGFGPLTLLGLFIGGSLALYWPAIWVGLFSDDFSLLTLDIGSVLRGSGWDHYRPIPLIAWKLIYPFGSTPGLHLLNVVLHGTNAWLTAGLAARLGHRGLVSVVAGLIFLTFPAVEPVAWASGIFDVAMVTCGLLYLHQSVAASRPTTGLIWLIGALLSKETAVILPLAAAVLRLRAGMTLRPLVGSAVLTIGYVALRLVGGVALRQTESGPLRYTVKELIARPFASLGVPYTASELAQHPFLLGAVGVALIAVLVLIYCSRPHARLRPVAGAAVVLIGVLPLWRIVFIGDHLEGARYLYLPLVGWSVLLVDLVAHQSAWRRYMSASALVIVFVLPGLWYGRQHLHAWQEAAGVRDSVLLSASQALAESGCPAGHFRHVPDSWQGVYIFRNGFREALRGRAVEAGAAPPACHFTWTTNRFAKGA